MTIIIDTKNLTKNQIIAKLYEIFYKCKILKKTSHGYIVEYENMSARECLKYSDMKDRINNLSNTTICI